MKCSICGSSTDTNPCKQCRQKSILDSNQFKQRFYAEKMAVDCSALDHIGQTNGYKKISNAAWTIAVGRKEDSEYLYGEKAGSLESLILLQEVAASAVRILDLFNFIRLAYNAGKLEQIRSIIMLELEKRNDPADDPVDVCDKRRQQNKKYLKRILFLLLGFFLGLLARLVY